MSAIISYPYLYNSGVSTDDLNTYNQAQFTAQGNFGAVTVPSSIVSISPPDNNAVILFSSAVRNNFGAKYMCIGNVTRSSSFTIDSFTSNDTSIINWFLLANTSTTSFANRTAFLPWYDNADSSQTCGKLTLGTGGQTTLTSKYLTNSTEAEARSRILMTLNTPFITDNFESCSLENYNPTTGSFTVSVPSAPFERSSFNYFIITKNNHPYIPTSGSGTYIKLVSDGPDKTYGFASILDNNPVTINTTAVEANSVIIACDFTVPSSSDIQVVYVQSSDIVPGVSFKIRIGGSLGSQTDISWLLIKPVGVP